MSLWYKHDSKEQHTTGKLLSHIDRSGPKLLITCWYTAFVSSASSFDPMGSVGVPLTRRIQAVSVECTVRPKGPRVSDGDFYRTQKLRAYAHPRFRSQRPFTLCPRKPLGIICRPPTLAYTFGQLEPSSAIPARHLSSTPGSANAIGPGAPPQ